MSPVELYALWSDNDIILLGVKIPQNGLKLARIGIFQPNPRSREIAIPQSHPLCRWQGKYSSSSGTWWEVQNWGKTNPRWRTAISWKYINRCSSAISRPICTKFGLQIDIRHTRVTASSLGHNNYTFVTIQDGGCRHLEFGLLAISLSSMKIISSTLVNDRYWPFED